MTKTDLQRNQIVFDLSVKLELALQLDKTLEVGQLVFKIQHLFQLNFILISFLNLCDQGAHKVVGNLEHVGEVARVLPILQQFGNEIEVSLPYLLVAQACLHLSRELDF